MRLMTPPLPAASRPSKITTTLSFWCDDPVLQLDELALQPEQLLEVEGPVDAGRLGPLRELRRQILQTIVIDLHLQLFIEAVDEFAAYAVVQIFGA